MSFNFAIKDEKGNELAIGWDQDDGDPYLSIEVEAAEGHRTFWAEFKIAPERWREIAGALASADSTAPPNGDRATIEALKIALEQAASRLSDLNVAYAEVTNTLSIATIAEIARWRAMAAPDWTAVPKDG